MVILIQTEEQYFEFIKNLANSDRILIPITNNSYLHPIISEFSLLFVYNLTNNTGYMVSENHPDLYKISDIRQLIGDNENTKCFIWNKKAFFHNHKLYHNEYFKCQMNNIVDINLIYWFKTNRSYEFNFNNSVIHRLFSNWYYNSELLNNIIPATKHVEFVQNKLNDILNIINYYYTEKLSDDVSFNFFNSKVISILHKIEHSGLKVNTEIFNKYFDYTNYKNNIIFSEYNIYTITGRPSNTFNRVNFVALNKGNGSRESFISRYDGGILVEIDFSAHHLSIIANLIKYKFPKNISIHEYFGRQYFGVKDRDLTKKEYNESKKISFQLLYGGINKNYIDIPFFKQVSKFIDKLWDFWNTYGFIICPISKRKIYKNNFKFNEINKQKLFNYLIQATELDKNILVIENILKILNDKNCKIILYIYDSILIDMDIQNIGEVKTKEILLSIKNIMEKDNYRVDFKFGINYDKMNKFTI